MKKYFCITAITILIAFNLAGCGDSGAMTPIEPIGNTTSDSNVIAARPSDATTDTEKGINIPVCTISDVDSKRKEWEMKIGGGLMDETNSYVYAEIDLFIGQKPNATDSIDGYYDVPAFNMLSPDGNGPDIYSFISLNGEEYWRDIKQICDGPCKKIWPITVKSSVANREIKLIWQEAPDCLFLIDHNTNAVTNMAEQETYSYENADSRNFSVVKKQ